MASASEPTALRVCAQRPGYSACGMRPYPSPEGRGGRSIDWLSHSGLITVMQKAARKAAPRLRRDFNEVEQLQVSRKGPADFVSMADQQAEKTIVEELRHARPDWRLTLEEGGEIDGDPRQAALDRRSARRHHQLPPRHPPFRHLDRGRGPERAAGQARDHPGAGLPAAHRRELLGGEGQGRLAQRAAAARLGPPRPRRGADRHRHPVQGPWRSWTASSKILDAVAPEVAGIRRFGSAALDLAWVAAGRYRRLLGGGSPVLGHRRRHPAGARGGRLRHRLPRRRRRRSPRARCSPPTTSSIRSCTSCCARRRSDLPGPGGVLLPIADSLSNLPRMLAQNSILSMNRTGDSRRRRGRRPSRGSDRSPCRDRRGRSAGCGFTR